jgi:hypothetical protein
MASGTMTEPRMQRLVAARLTADAQLDAALDAVAQRLAAWRVLAGGLAEASVAAGLTCAGALQCEQDLERIIRGRLGLTGRREHRRLLELDAELLRAVLSADGAPVDVTPSAVDPAP